MSLDLFAPIFTALTTARVYAPPGRGVTISGMASQPARTNFLPDQPVGASALGIRLPSPTRKGPDMASDDSAQKMKDALSSFPMDTSALENLARSQAALAEKLSAIAIEAAQRSTDLYARWIQDTLSKLPAVTQAQAEPAQARQARPA
jgi:hypothetical protein